MDQCLNGSFARKTSIIGDVDNGFRVCYNYIFFNFDAKIVRIKIVAKEKNQLLYRPAV